ncbi:thioesterase family protein [Nesterenkonia lacusekhoensis]|uniref:Acyl-coenzyme A thioesterase PaaI-like protein n=1 Tax=Nesterenkonia lacusekhoensis TaxID=150832 RepID=A0ABS4SZ81_9MICC|nr:thioesterase family protein [Nesterenkonia lacusekhoensis]MBP2317506.1 acyl-coenzyme A thioesterase PaaI-like protein [Nesterenkonia lacusekhoensis]
MSYFTALHDAGQHTQPAHYRATEHTEGAWNPQEQHVAPVFGLMVHVLQQWGEQRWRDQQSGQQPAGRRSSPPRPVRMSFDILGTLPVGEVSCEVHPLREGRTVELVEVVLSSGGRAAVRMRAWFLAEFNTEALAGSSFERLEPPESMEPWDATALWPGGFIASLEGRRRELGEGRGQVWIRSEHEVVEGEEVGELASFCSLLDTANGVAVRADPTEVAFPNLDLTVSFFRMPQGPWVGMDTTASIGATGLGLTHTVLHDADGPVGAMTQSLTVRPLKKR